MNVLKIKPDPNCSSCHGEGEQYDIVDWGSTTAMMPSFCDCVLEQIPDDDDDSEIELVFDDVTCLTCKGTGSISQEKYQEMLQCLPETRED